MTPWLNAHACGLQTWFADNNEEMWGFIGIRGRSEYMLVPASPRIHAV